MLLTRNSINANKQDSLAELGSATESSRFVAEPNSLWQGMTFFSSQIMNKIYCKMSPDSL